MSLVIEATLWIGLRISEMLSNNKARYYAIISIKSMSKYFGFLKTAMQTANKTRFVEVNGLVFK